MNIDQLTEFLGWCSLLNYFLLTIWFLLFMIARGWLYELHSSWFDITSMQFNQLHYFGIALYKVMVFVLNFVPYLTLNLM